MHRLSFSKSGRITHRHDPTYDLEIFVAFQPEGRAMSLSSGKHSTAGLRVLLAEDGAVNQRIAVRLLERLGHGVTIVETGKAALDAIRKDTFDVVLMDVEMPELDGLSATRAIRAHERHRGSRVPIIAVTTSDDAEGCFAAGMDAYLRKPFKPEQLNKAIEQVLRLSAA